MAQTVPSPTLSDSVRDSSAGALLRVAQAGGLLREIDVQLVSAAIRLYRVPADANPHGALALALASAVLADGHICLDFDNLSVALHARGLAELPEGFRENAATSAGRSEILRGWDALLAPAQSSPFVAEGSRLYLRRYYNYETAVAARLLALATVLPRPAPPLAFAALEQTGLNAGQRAAARMALERSLVLIAGGPGTGKTHTLARILQLLAIRDSGAPESPPPRVRLAAPTGKAAARMDESIRAASTSAAASTPALSIPPACTLEHLLGYKPNSPYFRHNADNPLEADIVVVDEASMIDLAKMAKLLGALGPGARLILLGDQHQLAAVEPGSVFGEMCAAPALAPCVARLEESRRFPPESLIGRLAAAINRARTPDDARAALDIAAPVLREPGTGDSGGKRDLLHAAREGYAPLLSARTPAEAFAALDTFRILCATRNGPGSVAAMNQLVERALEPCGLRPRGSGAFYPFRVVMVLRNDYSIGLFNGGVGIVLPAEFDVEAEADANAPTPAAPTAVWFPPAARANARASTGFRKIPVHLLPEHETAFAMTIHKSQGSEFDRVLVSMPEVPSPVLCKELLYTALTRARKTVSLHCPPSIFKTTLLQPILRFSGLAPRLT